MSLVLNLERIVKKKKKIFTFNLKKIPLLILE